VLAVLGSASHLFACGFLRGLREEIRNGSFGQICNSVRASFPSGKTVAAFQWSGEFRTGRLQIPFLLPVEGHGFR
jgi:hypothetical protein